MAVAYAFSKEEMAIDVNLGYPRAYSKLCKDTSLGPYTNGPPFTFTPYILPPHEASRAEELDDIFPIIDIEANPTTKTGTFVSILWKQLNHLGNAGFDPAMFRVDPYGNVVYFHADSASPLAWNIDHWFPCSRGGLTVPGNLRILQWQVCQRKHNQLEYLVPWWDLQLGISVNQFLSIFAAENSDFRQRAFRLLFQAGEHEELNDLQTVDSHNFPQAFIELKDQLGLAPATIVRNSKESSDLSSSTLTPLDINRQPRPSTPIIAAAKRLKNGVLKENEMPDMVTNPYQAIVMARDSLKQREKTKKMKTEIHRLDDEVNEFRLKNEEEMFTIQELEIELIKHKRKAEKCRKLAEAQSAHKAMLEKMISNAMHQSVVYKEQVRLNQAATNSLMARLEAQMSISNSAERELQRKFKQRDELEKQIGQEPEQARKRSRIENIDALVEEKEDKSLYLPRLKRERHLRKELREFLEEEQRLSKAALALIEEGNTEGIREEPLKLTLEPHIDEQNGEPDSAMEEMTEMPKHLSKRVSFAHDREVEEDEESMKRKGKGNVEKWLQMLLEDTEGVQGDDDLSPIKSAEQSGTSKSDEIIKMLNERYPQKEIKVLRFPGSKLKTQGMDEIVEMEEGSEKCKESNGKEGVTFNSDRGKRPMSPRRWSISSEANIIGNEGGKEKGFEKYERARLLRPFPSSPSKILKMRKGVDCVRKKPLVNDDANEYRDENQPLRHNILQSSMKTIKNVVKI